MTPDEARALIERYGYLGVFTRRQHRVLELIAEGKDFDEVAAELGITRGSARSHVLRALANIEVHERWEARRK